jgi:hypothetical protein
MLFFLITISLNHSFQQTYPYHQHDAILNLVTFHQSLSFKQRLLRFQMQGVNGLQVSSCSFSGILHRITCGLHLYHFQDVKTFNKTMILYSNSIQFNSIQFGTQYMGKRSCYFKFTTSNSLCYLKKEYLNFLCKHNTLLTGTAEWVNLNVKFCQDDHTKACNQNSSFRDWHCSLTTNKAIYKNVKQVISIHRQSKKRQYHACFYNSTSKNAAMQSHSQKEFKKTETTSQCCI